MFQTVRTLGLVLAATAVLGGCSAQLPVTATLTPKKDVVSSNASRGKVRVALAGLGVAAGRYQTLATKQDVARLKLVLTSHPGGKVQTRDLGLKELSKPLVYVDFDGVAAGKASLAVDAFDAKGRAIGKGENGTGVTAGKTSTVHVKVKLDAQAGDGAVDAVITFEESWTPEPTPRDGEEAFRKADKDADGWVSLDEYVSGWPHAWGTIAWPVEPMPKPVPMDRPVAATEPTTSAVSVPAKLSMPWPCYSDPSTGAPGVKTNDALIAPCPPYDPARREFRARDANGDGRLSLAEFLGHGGVVIAH